MLTQLCNEHKATSFAVTYINKYRQDKPVQPNHTLSSTTQCNFYISLS